MVINNFLTSLNSQNIKGEKINQELVFTSGSNNGY